MRERYNRIGYAQLSMREEGKLLRGEQCRDKEQKAVLTGPLYRERLKRKMSQRMRLSQKAELNQPVRGQKELGRVNLFSTKSQRLKTFEAQDKIIQRLEASRTRPKLADKQALEKAITSGYFYNPLTSCFSFLESGPYFIQVSLELTMQLRLA